MSIERKVLDPDKKYKIPEPRTETESLVRQLYRLAAQWYQTKDQTFVEQYHVVYNTLREMGWNGAIDIEAELPDELMPEEYMKKIDEVRKRWNNSK